LQFWGLACPLGANPHDKPYLLQLRVREFAFGFAACTLTTNRLKEAEPLMERQLVILLQFTRRTGHPHPHLEAALKNYEGLLTQMGYSKDEVVARLNRLAP